MIDLKITGDDLRQLVKDVKEARLEYVREQYSAREEHLKRVMDIVGMRSDLFVRDHRYLSAIAELFGALR